MMKSSTTKLFLPLLLLLGLASLPASTMAQRPGRPTPAADTSEKKDSTDKKKEKTFAEIITKDAKTMAGMLSVHQVADKFYFEIPDSLFGRDIMAITRVSKAPTGAGYGGEQANREVFRFEKGPAKNVFIRIVDYINVSADTTQPITTAVTNSNVAPIAAAFDIKATRKDTSILIDVSNFFAEPNQAFSLPPRTEQRYKLRKLEKDRSYIESIRAYPINVEVRCVRTYTVAPPTPPSPGSAGRSSTVDLGAGVSSGAVTFEMNTSMILLPKEPARRRFFDPRVGIFATGYTVFDGEDQRAENQVFTVRWRLEAKNAADARRQQQGELIEPKKPIVFYIDPATPVKWRNYLKQGVEDWQVAFEQAGWKNAILAKDWPEQDTTMSLEDARFSVIRYFASEVQNAYGPNVHDPRSGEILESHIGWYHNVMRLLKNWYTTQTAAVDEKARKNVFDDELMGNLVRFVSSHEVGHTLGLRHNFGASSATPVEKLRDPAWLAENGHTSSIMDYARFNYVAQPGDGVTNLFPRIGAYDRWAIEWNYKPIYNTGSPEEDKKILNKWYLDKAAANPAMHFLTESSTYDPRAQSEDLSDNSMVASEYGIENLKRILPNAIDWTKEEAEYYEMADELYNNVFGQYRRYIGHVTKWVGGIFESPKTYDQDGVVYEPAPANMQRDAVAFLQRNLFREPMWLLDPKILQKIKADMGVNTVGGLQQSTLSSLYGTARLQRLIEAKSAVPGAYGLEDFYSDMQKGIWAEAVSGASATVFRRNLQKAQLETLIELLKPARVSGSAGNSSFRRATPDVDPVMTDISSLTRGTLKELHATLKKSAKRAPDKLTKYHYEDCMKRIEEALDMED